MILQKLCMGPGGHLNYWKEHFITYMNIHYAIHVTLIQNVLNINCNHKIKFKKEVLVKRCSMIPLSTCLAEKERINSNFFFPALSEKRVFAKLF